MKRPIRHWFQNSRLRDKLLLCFFALIMIPCLVMSFFSFSISRHIVEEKTNRYSHDILMQTTNMMESLLTQMEAISFNIFIDSEVQVCLNQLNRIELDDYAVSVYRKRLESALAAQVLYHDEISAAFVRTLDGDVYMLDKTMRAPHFPGTWEMQIENAFGGTVWFSDLCEQNIIVLSRSIYDLQTQKRLGDVILYINAPFFADVLKNTQSFMNGEIYTIDQQGQIVFDAHGGHAGQQAETAGMSMEAYSFVRQHTNEKPHYVAVSEVMSNGWRVMSLVPVAIYQREIVVLRNLIFLLGALVFLMAVFCAWWIARGVSRPLQMLNDAMTLFGDGQLSARCALASKDETGMCAAAFNEMADNINHLISEVYQEQLMKREAELKALRMQINPHFLYNTLETINWMARMKGNEEVGQVAKSLGDLLRSTIGGKAMIPLSEELVSLNHYLLIQKYRYGDKFLSYIEASDEAQRLLVPKLLLQPLVENAIYHGVESAFGQGHIVVSAAVKEKQLLITVSDDGVGMDEETVKRLTSPEQTDDNSIGLQNVIKRIRTLYGEPYGLTIHSEIGEGTDILIRLPIIDEPKEEKSNETV